MVQMLRSASDEKAAVEMIKQQFAVDLVVTNLGKLFFETSFRDVAIKAVWGPMALDTNHESQIIGVATINNTLHMTHTSLTPLPSLLENTKQILISTLGD